MAHMRYFPLLEGNFCFQIRLNYPWRIQFFFESSGSLRPKFVVPGSAGFRYRDEFKFLISIHFLLHRNNFYAILKIFSPKLIVVFFIQVM
ncbi:MAG: hypothetical protein CM1200mP16_03680 [Nitrospina sp.]|nr:MAG: hypothetical protein CM1200mP16_03680 [Nitrospina sp.]